jgi:hypothetical protein
MIVQFVSRRRDVDGSVALRLHQLIKGRPGRGDELELNGIRVVVGVDTARS